MSEGTSLAAVRDEVCHRIQSILPNLAARAGFRRVPGRPKELRCIHGEDRNPSARIHKGRVKCFSCGGSWSAIDLLMIANGCDFIHALKIGAAETSVHWPELSAEERAKLAWAKPEAAKLAQEISDWTCGLNLFAEKYKADLVESIDWAAENYAEDLCAALEGLLEAIPRAALTPDDADPALLASAYQRSLKECPEAAARVRERGRRNREHAELIGAEVKRMIIIAAMRDRAESEFQKLDSGQAALN